MLHYLLTWMPLAQKIGMRSAISLSKCTFTTVVKSYKEFRLRVAYSLKEFDTMIGSEELMAQVD